METLAYRIYVTDCFYLQGQQKVFQERWSDLMDINDQNVDERSADEIAFDIMSKAGLTFKEGGE